MAQREANPIKPPNITHPGDRRDNGWLPTTGHASMVHGSNDQFKANGGGDRGMSFPDTKRAGGIKPPNDGELRFDIAKFKMPDDPNVKRPAEGAIPVEPGQRGTFTDMYIRDSSKG